MRRNCLVSPTCTTCINSVGWALVPTRNFRFALAQVSTRNFRFALAQVPTRNFRFASAQVPTRNFRFALAQVPTRNFRVRVGTSAHPTCGMRCFRRPACTISL
jgi:hypothetical protein